MASSSGKQKKRTARADAVSDGRRVGVKKSDRRWLDAHGQLWASKLESDLFEYFRSASVPVRRSDASDSIPYTTRVRQGRCGSCNSKDIRQEHTYTPDLCVGAAPGLAKASGNHIEAKGYLRASDRRILRGVMQARPDFNLHLVLQRYHKGTVDWARKFLKIPVLIFAKDTLIEAP